MGGVERWSQLDVDIIFNLKYGRGWSEPQIADYVASHYRNRRVIKVAGIRYVLRSRRPSPGVPNAPSRIQRVQIASQVADNATDQSMCGPKSQAYNPAQLNLAPTIGDYASNQPIELTPAQPLSSYLHLDPSIFAFEGQRVADFPDDCPSKDDLHHSKAFNMSEDEISCLVELFNSEKQNGTLQDRAPPENSYSNSLRHNQDCCGRNSWPKAPSTSGNRFGGVKGAPVAASSINFENFQFTLDPLCDARFYEDYPECLQQETQNFQDIARIPYLESKSPEMTINLESPEFYEPFLMPLDMNNWIVDKSEECTISLQKKVPTGQVTINLKNPKFHSGFHLSENLVPPEACQELLDALKETCQPTQFKS